MKDYKLFDVSDYGAQKNPGWRVRWGHEGANAVLMVNLTPLSELKEWKLIWSDAPIDVFLKDGEFIALPRERHEIKEKIAWIPREAEKQKALPEILLRAWKEQRTRVPAPRRKQEEPYITKEVAEILEKKFFDVYLAPYIDTHRVFAVAQSGELLCKRLGITNYTPIYVNHYESNTYQADNKISVVGITSGDAEMPVLVIDDMVSSGRTARAILNAFEKEGILKVRYATLFDIVASREVHEVDSAVESLLPISNFYWMYGRGMDIFDESSRKVQSIYGADKSYGIETEENINALFDFFDKQS